jgi:hypothetical protein
MNERERLLMEVVNERLRPLWNELVAEGWRPEVVVFAPGELPRIPGYKVCFVVPLDTIPDPVWAQGRA